MREIKFRAWDEENGMYVVQNLYFDKEGNLAMPYHTEKMGVYVMQYTGLKDKNGKEIYEGDIVYSTYYRHNIEIEDIFTMYKWFDYPESEEFEIIGNIYENPELLK